MSDAAVCAVSGIAALPGVLFAAQSGRRVALANKEAMVCAGSLIKAAAKESGAMIIPVDSEHSAIFQCLEGNIDRGEIVKLILTASGGPFFGKTKAELEKVTAAEALCHPNWKMGPKISVDSATMMNKGLEIIEAMRLYDLPRSKISVVIHPESVIHSLVEYCDGALLAMLSQPDMRLPIQYALTYPARRPTQILPLDLASCGLLSFSRPDEVNFPCLAIASRVSEEGELHCTAMNAANEAAVGAFLSYRIGFNDIPEIIDAVLNKIEYPGGDPGLEAVLETDNAARMLAERIIRQRGR
jgi:1-deoxy-D-xylulose-5-phosphate reductoisomerase